MRFESYLELKTHTHTHTYKEMPSNEKKTLCGHWKNEYSTAKQRERITIFLPTFLNAVIIDNNNNNNSLFRSLQQCMQLAAIQMSNYIKQIKTIEKLVQTIDKNGHFQVAARIFKF